MKGLAKNNKTRGKITRRKKNNRKTIRKGNKRGGGMEDIFNNEKTLEQQKTELISRKNKAGEDYQKILNRTAAAFNKVELDFVQLVKQTNNKTGYTETKDENQPPNKKTKYNDPNGTIAAAEAELEEIMNSLNNEREIATTEYNAELKNIEKESSIIKQKEKEQQETAETNARKDKEIEENMLMNQQTGRYLEPYDNGTVFKVDQTPYLTSKIKKEIEADNKEHDERERDGMTFNGGKKRKTYKKRK